VCKERERDSEREGCVPALILMGIIKLKNLKTATSQLPANGFCLDLRRQVQIIWPDQKRLTVGLMASLH